MVVALLLVLMLILLCIDQIVHHVFVHALESQIVIACVGVTGV